MTGSPPAEGWDELWTLFAEARELVEGDRQRFLAEVCAERPALGRELLAMLGESAADHALEVERRLLDWDDESLPVGLEIGPYRLVRPLARGGMGEVYLGERSDGAYRQQVAVKLLRPGLEATDMVDRFRQERDLLARLTHPAVVPLLDAGVTPDGRPYLVLQYVEGLPITDWCGARELSRRQRLALFAKLCRAVQYAHSNLIVHRDLKPSNVLVDGTGDIRLLDFGIAKLLSAPAASETTRAAAVAPLTPARAAPEQFRGEAVTTATDAWALGLLLHEILTGELPPGAAASASGAGGEVPGGTGGRRVRASAGALPPDLAAIVERCCRQAPEDRYASAGELADDVERWLDGKPVRARPDRLGYRLRRFAGRHRAAVAIGAVAFVALSILTVTSVAQSARAVRASERAAGEERKTKVVLDLLLQTFGATDPHRGAIGDTVNIGDLLAQGEERAAGLDAQPEIQAALRHALGRIRLERGEFPLARELLAAARQTDLGRYGELDPRTLPVRVHYARALHAIGARDEAEKELRAALTVLEASPRPDPDVEVGILQVLGMVVTSDEGIAQLERAVALVRSRPQDHDPVELADLLTSLAVRRRMSGDRERARALFEEAYATFARVLGSESPRTLAARSNLALLIDDPAVRVAEHRELLEIRRRRLGEVSSGVANSWNHLGSALSEIGRHREAEAAFRQALATWTTLAGPDYPLSLRAQHAVAESLVAQNRIEEADAVYAQVEEQLRTSSLDPATAERWREERVALRARRER